MSAFIVRNTTINNIVSVLAQDDYMVRQIKKQFYVDISIDSGRSQFAHRLYALNVSGVSARYGSADSMIGDGFEYKHEYDCGHLEAFKNLQTLLYQCNEGNVAEKSDLFKFLNVEAFKHIAKKVIYGLPEYGALEWE